MQNIVNMLFQCQLYYEDMCGEYSSFVVIKPSASLYLIALPLLLQDLK